ncbi:hypothetical protein E1202_03280 [Saccharopolyspora karakumensis]|uniref:EamA-like transporter family protein n=1 Tax=Saccharopolyspora karakumensis TaxID=2530386 RepID=A0A4R5C2D1_9PSEU|nr:hypothetical protein E1202_03280 [Saccharopolyspora karakumensis]
MTSLCGQVLGWLLIPVGSPRLRVEVGSSLLLLTPVGALLLGAVALGEVPSALHALGCALVLGSAHLVAAGSGREPGAEGRLKGILRAPGLTGRISRLARFPARSCSRRSRSTRSFPPATSRIGMGARRSRRRRSRIGDQEVQELKCGESVEMISPPFPRHSFHLGIRGAGGT